MKPRSYTQSLTQLLEPLGFVRSGSDWLRRTGDIEECINLQKSGIDGGVTINLRSVDVASKRILHEAAPAGSPQLKWWVNQRIGHVFGRYDVWWKNNPNGPSEVSEKVRDYGLPFLEKFRDPMEQAKWFGFDELMHGNWSQGPTVGKLAVTLHRMGKDELICKALDVPRRRHEIEGVVAQITGLRRYFNCPPNDAWPAP